MKNIIVSSLNFWVAEKRIKLHVFVLMPNHIYLIWQKQDEYEKPKVQQSFLKYTAQQMKFFLLAYNLKELERYKVKASDRQNQFWERNPLSVDLWSRPFFYRS